MTGSVTSRYRRSGLAFGAVCAFFVASSPALACNPFELLFGGCRETQTFRSDAPAYYPAPRGDTRIRVEKPRANAWHAAAPTNSNGVSGKQKPITASAEAPVGSLALFEKDRTLRAGDVVVTTTGFRVYEGRGSFTPIAHDGGKLATLEKVSMMRKASDGTFAAAADKAKPEQSAAATESAAPARPSPMGLRTQARAASNARIVASGG